MSALLLETGVAGVVGMQDFIRVYLPVLQSPFDQARDHHEQQDEDIDAGENLVHHRRLFDPKCQKALKTRKTKKRGEE